MNAIAPLLSENRDRILTNARLDDDLLGEIALELGSRFRLGNSSRVKTRIFGCSTW